MNLSAMRFSTSTHYGTRRGAIALIIITLRRMTLCIRTHGIMTLSIVTFGIMTLVIRTLCHYVDHHYAECSSG